MKLLLQLHSLLCVLSLRFVRNKGGGEWIGRFIFIFSLKFLPYAKIKHVSNRKICAINIMDKTQYSGPTRKPQLHKDRNVIYYRSVITTNWK